MTSGRPRSEKKALEKGVRLDLILSLSMFGCVRVHLVTSRDERVRSCSALVYDSFPTQLF